MTNNKLSLVTSPGAEIRQKIAVRLRFFKGEWFLDQNIGVPYFQAILVKNPNLATVQSIYRQAIVTVPGVTDVQNFNYTYSAAARTLNISFQVATNTAGVLDFNQSFIIGNSP